MKISKLFHWLYAILMFMPFGLLIFNCLHCLFSPTEQMISLSQYWQMIDFNMINGALSKTIGDAYYYLVVDIFGFYESDSCMVILNCLTYWTCISIIWLIFDVVMYVPLLIHRWIDKAKLE